MLKTTINTKIAKLEAIRQIIDYCEGQRNYYAIHHDDGSKSAPLIDCDEWDFCYYKAWDELINTIMKEVK